MEVVDVKAFDEVTELDGVTASLEEELVAVPFAEEIDCAVDVANELVSGTDEVDTIEDDNNTDNCVEVETEELAELANDRFVYRFNLLPPPQYSVAFPLQS